jgi:hypothetical protein
VLHALFGVVPAFFLVLAGHLTWGIAFAIGLLPTSLLGFAPKRKHRVIYGIVGCLFGVGVFLGSVIINWQGVWLASAVFVAVAYAATVLSVRRPAGGLLLSIVVPSLAVGTGYARGEAFALMAAFMLGSVWSSLVMLPWPEFEPDPTTAAKLIALQPKHVKSYGLLLGLTAATSLLVGHYMNSPYAGWIATAAMLIMRPIQDMTGWRGIGRAISTTVGTVLVIITLNQQFSYGETAVLVAAVAIVTIGARASRMYITPFGTAFLILTIELYGVDSANDLHRVGWIRIINNVIGAAIALFYGLAIPWFIEWNRQRRKALELAPRFE